VQIIQQKVWLISQNFILSPEMVHTVTVYW
jgi:hypothetical protein